MQRVGHEHSAIALPQQHTIYVATTTLPYWRHVECSAQHNKLQGKAMIWSFSGRRLWLATVVAFLLAIALSYILGTLSGHSARVRDAQAAEQQYSALATALQTARAQAASARSLSSLRAAHVAIYRAAAALDNRNFGVANNEMAKAVVSLRSTDAAAAGLDVDALRALTESISRVDIAVAANLSSQRSEILRFADDLEALTPDTR